jgi:hypothetical protein
VTWCWQKVRKSYKKVSYMASKRIKPGKNGTAPHAVNSMEKPGVSSEAVVIQINAYRRHVLEEGSKNLKPFDKADDVAEVELSKQTTVIERPVYETEKLVNEPSLATTVLAENKVIQEAETPQLAKVVDLDEVRARRLLHDDADRQIEEAYDVTPKITATVKPDPRFEQFVPDQVVIDAPEVVAARGAVDQALLKEEQIRRSAVMQADMAELREFMNEHHEARRAAA